DIVITPVVYKVAKLMGTEDYTAVMFQLERAAKQAEATGSSTSITVGDDTIVLTPSNGTSSDSSGSTDTGSDSTSTEPANTFSSGVVAVGSYTNNISNGASSNYGTFTIRYYKGKSGYAGYDPGDRDNSNPESKVKTQNYDPDFDSDNKLKAANIIGDAGFIAYSNLSNQLVTGASIQENMLEHKL
ncbi:MAG: hypothetical protein IJ675_02240, partial [Pseudobutyrivibrio sp.]|nr:hypothetical protein [Pseudobutyrivibrio sp.]